MASLFYAQLEAYDENHDATALSLYFVGKPTEDELVAAVKAENGRHALQVLVNDDHFEALEQPNKVSQRANLMRYQALPLG